MSDQKNIRNLHDVISPKRRRLNSDRAIPIEAQSKQTMQQNDVIDLTNEEEMQQERQNESSHTFVHALKLPAHLDSDDYFTILNLSRSASESEIKRAYRKLAVQWHPDKNRSHPRAEEVFKKISEAYEVLSDSEKRNQYKNAGLQQGVFPTTESFGGYGHARGFSSQRARDIFEAFFGGESPFEAFYGDRQRQSRGVKRNGRDSFESMGFGGMNMAMQGFGQMSGMSMMDHFFNDNFTNGSSNTGMFATSTSSSSWSSMLTDQNGNVIEQKTTTSTGPDGRMKTVTEEYRNGKLVNSSSSTTATNRLADAGRMRLEGRSSIAQSSHHRFQSSNLRPKY